MRASCRVSSVTVGLLKFFHDDLGSFCLDRRALEKIAIERGLQFNHVGKCEFSLNGEAFDGNHHIGTQGTSKP